MVTGTSAAAEWRRYFILPVAAALGYATSVIHIYSLGPYIIPISETFGWSRVQVSAGLTVAMLGQALMSIPTGILVDRFGPRLFGLIGVLLTCGAFALLGTATGGKGNWYLLWLIFALASGAAQGVVWTTAVATRFKASRGLAFAVTMTGASVAAALFPWLGTSLIGNYGWRTALQLHALIWLVISLPAVFFFFRGASDKQRQVANAPAVRPELDGMTIAEGLRSSIFLRLVLVGILFIFPIMGVVISFVLILTDGGIGALEAAGLASLIGLSSIGGRLGTGALIDRFRASRIGATALLLPAFGAILLVYAGTDARALSIAAIFIGLAVGAEIDVMAYLTSEYFGLKNYGALFGTLSMVLQIGVAFGPLGASAVYDAYGDYQPFLWMTCIFMVVGSLTLFSLPRSSKRA